uniref:Uncharacterized protein n=1 Tax=Arundo donax TaxID=35708 RepID=A0A0A8XYI1_ARUDO
MVKLFYTILNTTRSGSEIMPVPMKDLGAMTGPATSTGQGTSRGGGKTCRTSRIEMHLLRRVVSTAPHLHLARTRCHPVKALLCTMVRETCLCHHMLLAAHQTTNPKCQTRRQATPLAVHLPTSKVVLLATKADLPGTRAVTKVTKGTQAQVTQAATLDTKVVRQVTKVATHPPLLTKEATPTHPPTKVVAILAMVVAHQATQVVKEETQDTNDLARDLIL